MRGNEWEDKARKTKNKTARHSKNKERPNYKHHEMGRQRTSGLWRKVTADDASGRKRYDGTIVRYTTHASFSPGLLNQNNIRRN